jgi:mono/diheme cytochrome c family protein
MRTIGALRNRISGWSAIAVISGALALLGSAAGSAQQPAIQATALDGVFTAAQAQRGGEAYAKRCAECHDGADVDGPPLTGTPFIDRWREDSVGRLLEFVKTQMPQSAPGSLPEATYVDIVAHLLSENSYPAGTRELTAATAATTLLVGENGPQPLPAGALVEVVGCLAKGSGSDWTVARAGRPSRVRSGREITAAEASAAAGVPLGSQTFTLQDDDAGTTGPGGAAAGQKVVVKGALTQRGGVDRIRVTAAKSVADSCG